ncbi:hypothetical protein E4T56_gene13903, partial [Termitomyces sp. T112]
MARQDDRGAPILGIHRLPADQFQPARRAGLVREAQDHHAIFGMFAIGHADIGDIGIKAGQQRAILRDIARRIEQRAQRAFADRPALAALILKADLARPFEAEHAGHLLAGGIGTLDEIGAQRLDPAQGGNGLIDLGRRIRSRIGHRGGGGHKR